MKHSPAKMKRDILPWLVLTSAGIFSVFIPVVAGIPMAIFRSPLSGRVLKGSSLLVQCSITDFVNSPDQGLAWMKNNAIVAWNGILLQSDGGSRVTVSNFTSGSYTTVYTLSFTMVTTEDEGFYTCVMTKGRRDAFTEVVSDSLGINVIDTSPVCSPAEEIYLIEGSEISIKCTIESLESNRDRSLYWENPTTSEVFGGIEIELEFSNVNEIRLTATQTLDNNAFECNSLDMQTCTAGPFQIVAGFPVIAPKSLTVDEGETALFACTLPTAQSTKEWYTIPATTAEVILTANAFSIPNTVRSRDNGKVVVCKASVGDDELEDRAFLTVNAVPTSPPTTQAPPSITVAPFWNYNKTRIAIGSAGGGALILVVIIASVCCFGSRIRNARESDNTNTGGKTEIKTPPQRSIVYPNGFGTPQHAPRRAPRHLTRARSGSLREYTRYDPSDPIFTVNPLFHTFHGGRNPSARGHARGHFRKNSFSSEGHQESAREYPRKDSSRFDTMIGFPGPLSSGGPNRESLLTQQRKNPGRFDTMVGFPGPSPAPNVSDRDQMQGKQRKGTGKFDTMVGFPTSK